MRPVVLSLPLCIFNQQVGSAYSNMCVSVGEQTLSSCSLYFLLRGPENRPSAVDSCWIPEAFFPAAEELRHACVTVHRCRGVHAQMCRTTCGHRQDQTCFHALLSLDLERWCSDGGLYPFVLRPSPGLYDAQERRYPTSWSGAVAFGFRAVGVWFRACVCAC